MIGKGSATEYYGDTVVNAASKQDLGGGGLDNAFNAKGGEGLKKHRLNLPVILHSKNVDVRIRTGEARWTLPGACVPSNIIHASEQHP